VNFQVNLPLQWNGKAVQYGGGAYNGTLITGLQPLRDARRDTPVPVARGFATWGTDSGHEATRLPEPPAFARNDEALINYAYASYKNTRDAGRRIATQYYGRPPSKTYYFGGSEGGREALMMAQRFPNDFDGIVSVVPAINFMGTLAAELKTGIAQQNGGWLNPAKVTTLRMATSAACDAADGLADGVVGAYEKCVGVFDPKSLRCANGADTGNDCLSDAQIAAVETLHRPTQLPFALANGLTSYPGWNYGSEDQAGGMVQYVTGLRPARFPDPSPEGQGIHWSHGNGGARYFIARDAKLDPFAFAPSKFSDRMRQLSEMLDATDPDLSAFLARNGKLILKANGADFALSPFQVIDYYKSVVAKLGQPRADQFIRFYVTPGVNHQGNGVLRSGEAVPAKIDLLGALDAWVDTGEPPGPLMQVSQEANAPFSILSSRPMCRYPLYPHYDGRGDPKQASSFTCTPQ
jgi:feruloyl esterase